MANKAVKSKRERKPRQFKREDLQKLFGVSTMAEYQEKYGEYKPPSPKPELIEETGELLYMVLDEEEQ